MYYLSSNTLALQAAGSALLKLKLAILPMLNSFAFNLINYFSNISPHVLLQMGISKQLILYIVEQTRGACPANRNFFVFCM
jgi:hypothetical protein